MRSLSDLWFEAGFFERLDGEVWRLKWKGGIVSACVNVLVNELVNMIRVVCR